MPKVGETVHLQPQATNINSVKQDSDVMSISNDRLEKSTLNVRLGILIPNASPSNGCLDGLSGMSIRNERLGISFSMAHLEYEF